MTEAGRVRAYRDDDLDAVLGIWADATAQAHPFLDEAFLEQERQDIVDVYLPRADTWVWESPTGHVLAYMALLGSEVGALFVRPGAQQAGIGRALIDHARDLRGDVEVEVFERNAIGRAFYDRLGFTRIGSHVHDATGQTLLRLRLEG